MLDGIQTHRTRLFIVAVDNIVSVCYVIFTLQLIVQTLRHMILIDTYLL